MKLRELISKDRSTKHKGSVDQQGVTEGAEPQYEAAKYIDEYANGDTWYIKGKPEIIRQFVQLANSLEDEAVKGTEYEPGKGMMANIHQELGDSSTPQWKIVPAQNLEQLKPIGSGVLRKLVSPNLSDGVEEFISEFLWGLEEKGLAQVSNDEGVAEDWSTKYKRSIDCNNPKGFSQRAHCQGRKKNEDLDDIGEDTSLEEGPSLPSTLKSITTNGEPIAQLYGRLKAMASRWMDNNGRLKGFHRNAAGQSAQWFNNFYFNNLQADLYALAKQAPKHAAPLLDFLKDASEDRENRINFTEISRSLPPILIRMGQKMGDEGLVRFATNWNARREDYESYLDSLEYQTDTDDADEPVVKPEKNKISGQQNAQVEQIVNSVLAKLPKKISGEIRNAIARSPNKLQALHQELTKRNIQNVAEDSEHTFAGKDPLSFKSPKGGTPKMMIVTAQGSRYLITSDGMVLRNKSFHANTGGEDQGLQSWSDVIEFYDPAEQPGGVSFPLTVAKAVEKRLPVSLSKTADGKRALLIHDGSQWRIAKISDVYKHVASQDAPIVATYSKTPKLNWNVLDYTLGPNNGLKSVHPGSPVTHGITLSKQQSVAEDSDKCPPATQNIELNLENRQKAIDEYGYGPLNPDLPNRKFWMKKVDEWNLDSVDEAKQSLCGNCAAFDQRQETLDCIAQGIDKDNPQDAEATIDAGDLGYCKFLKFKCASRRTCDAWVTGGPLTDSTQVNESLVNESKSAPLYHFTSWNSLVKILSTNQLVSPNGKIYLTRDYKRQFLPRKGELFKQSYGLRIDQNLLAQDYGRKLQAGGQDIGWDEKKRQAWLSDPKNADEIEKIKRTGRGNGLITRGANPVDIVKGTIGQSRRWESEEHLNIQILPNLNKYITGIVISDSPIGADPHFVQSINPDPVTKTADMLINLFSGPTGSDQRNWLLDTAIKLGVPLVYERKEFDPTQIKNRIIQLYSQRKKEREEEKNKPQQDFVIITNPGGGGTIAGGSDINSAIKKLADDPKWRNKEIYSYRVGIGPGGEEKKFNPPIKIIDFDKNAKTQKIGENFADGRNPQDRGDSARHGIRKGMSIAQLKKIRSSDSASARKKQLAHWQINMRQGKKK